MPMIGALGVSGRGGSATRPQAGILAGAEDVPEFANCIPLYARKPALDVVDPHCGHLADQHWVAREAIDNHRRVIQRRCLWSVPKVGVEPLWCGPGATAVRTQSVDSWRCPGHRLERLLAIRSR